MVTERYRVVGCNEIILPDETPDGYSPELPPRRLTPEEMLRQEIVGRLIIQIQEVAKIAEVKHYDGQITVEDLERIIKAVETAAFELRTFHNSESYQRKL